MPNDSTRNQLMQAARKVFIRQGYENTSMSDIARESGKGRRTLYLYFDSKLAIYQAVINVELDKITDALQEIATKDIPPQIKVIDLVYGRFRILKEAVYRNGTLRSGFFRDIWNVEHFRKEFDRKEKQILMNIITEGKASGLFHVDSVSLTVDFLQCFLRGFEAPYIRGRIWQGHTQEEVRMESKRLIYGVLGYNPQPAVQQE